MVGAERNEGEVPGALDGGRKRALVLGAYAGLAPGLYLPAVGHVSPEAVGVLVVYVFDVIYAEPANLAAGVVSGPAAPAAEASARSAAGSAAAGSSARTSRTPAGTRTRTAARTGASRSSGWPYGRRSGCRWSGCRLCGHGLLTCLLRLLLRRFGAVWISGPARVALSRPPFAGVSRSISPMD